MCAGLAWRLVGWGPRASFANGKKYAVQASGRPRGEIAFRMHHVQSPARLPFGYAMRLLIAAAIVAAAAPQLQNPRRGDPEAIRQGAAIYRERCAECHGADAKGVRGPDLTGLWTSDGADRRVFQTIRAGVPGSIMPPSSAP